MWDTRTGATAEVNVPELAGSLVAADHRRTRVYFADSANNRLVVIEPAGTTPVPMTGSPIGGAISSDGQELYLLQTTAGGDVQVAIVSTATFGQREVNVGPRALSVLPTLPGEFITTATDLSGTTSLMRHDSTTGAVLASWQSPLQQQIKVLRFDMKKRELFVDQFDVFNGHTKLLVLDAETLTLARTIDTGRQFVTISGLIEDSRRGRFYLVGQGCGYYRYSCDTPFVDAFDLSFSPLQRVNFPGFGCVHAVLAPHPPPPADLRASVIGSQVALDWSHGESAPGRATDWEVRAFVGDQLAATIRTSREVPGFTVSGVPSGTYRVWVTGLNDAGAGAPSQEIVVVVP